MQANNANSVKRLTEKIMVKIQPKISSNSYTTKFDRDKKESQSYEAMEVYSAKSIVQNSSQSSADASTWRSLIYPDGCAKRSSVSWRGSTVWQPAWK